MKLQKLLFLLTFSVAISACCDVFKKNCPKVKGCTDPNSTTFDPDAEEDDGSCQYPPNVTSSTSYGTYSNKNGNNPQYQITNIPEVLHGAVETYLNNSRSYIEIKNVKVTTQDGFHNEITDLEVQEKNGANFYAIPNFVATSTENTTIAIVLVLQQSLVSASNTAQNNKAIHDRMISYAKALVDKFKLNADSAKIVNPAAQRKYYISVVGYGSKNNVSDSPFPTEPLSDLTLSQVKTNIESYTRLDTNYAALGKALLLANDKINAFPSADYKCIIAIGDGTETDSENKLAPAIAALKSGTVNGVYCLGVLEDGFSSLGVGELSYTELSTILEDGLFQKAAITEQTRPVFYETYKNIPNNYDLKYERSTQTTDDIEIRWVMTTKPKK